ncbi:MAG: flagellar hook-basal body complex protein FliE [Bryobacteraceae bacterium]
MPDSISPATGPGPGGDFRSVLGSAIGNVEKLRNEAAQSAQRFLAGDSEEIHSVALATQRAELALEVFVQVRNKVVSAYQAVMQMQV